MLHLISTVGNIWVQLQCRLCQTLESGPTGRHKNTDLNIGKEGYLGSRQDTSGLNRTKIKEDGSNPESQPTNDVIKI